MITTAITLFALIILFAAISCSSLTATVFGIIKKRKKLWVINLSIFLLSTCLFLITSIYTGTKVINRTYTTTQTLAEKGKTSVINFIAPAPPSPDIRFTRFTGLEWPENARVITTGDENWLFEWEYYLVFEIDREVLEKWLESQPPWEVEEWVRGPVPNGAQYFGKPYHSVELENSENVWYAAKEYCCDDMAFHSADVIILDFDANRVWLASWDY